jgi:hypothetical protein
MAQIKNIEDLLNHFGADTPGGLNRRIYKDTGCGASISLYLTDGRVFHNGWKNLETWPSAEEIDQTGLSGFTIQTIVEGSERTVDSDMFSIPCETAAVDRFVEWMEEESERIWQEDNIEAETEEQGETS